MKSIVMKCGREYYKIILEGRNVRSIISEDEEDSSLLGIINHNYPLERGRRIEISSFDGSTLDYHGTLLRGTILEIECDHISDSRD